MPEWDEHGNPITHQEWDENGKPISMSSIPGAPNGLPPIGGPSPMQESNLARVTGGAPLTGMESGLPSPAQTPENREAMEKGAAAGSILAAPIAGGVKALPAVGRTLAGSLGVGTAGAYLGGKIAGPTGAQIGGTAGALLGGIAGARGVEIPQGKFGLLGKLLGGSSEPIPEYMPPAHEEIPSGSTEYPLREKIRMGIADKIPNRLTIAQQNLLREKAQPIDLSKLAGQVPSESSRIYGPESPAPAINKTYVSYPGDLLVELAKKGDLNAVRELIRNPRGININDIPGVRYLMESGRQGVVYGGPK